ncbi:conserved hypothetical protein [Talaromyces stipitatus ATCC 10500]|uniref:Putative zinc-finger domain-containing protein n=1 Tax=Talaromyces stipitatus (strain ATCC 10500 / CBS 375.48 / QM 6759 / NRRL 1006) TaxID=441959 RepID=B8MDB4_TALSN|nr:uncharacterized protein TSTA_114500 [Talaromyces stipitatus ATCC 10500]EED17639.1 conserved hypothetical protein [Talaromyces stipitatus ATCC 10500]
MSQYPVPPSYDGQHNYAPTWPMQLPYGSSDPKQSGTNFFAMNNAPTGIANFAGLPFGSNDPIQLPGLGMPSNATPLPYLPQQFANRQMPLPLYSAANFPFSTPADSLHPNQQSAVTQPSENLDSLAIQRQERSKRPSPLLTNDTEREEGEVSDGSSYGLSRQHHQPGLQSGTFTQTSREAPIPRSETALDTDASFSHLQSPKFPIGKNGARDEDPENSAPGNNSPPYNPPVTIGINQLSPAKVQRADASRPRKSEVNNQSSYSQFNGKTPAQIREMALGALLSLVPHNIRYGELVKEDIDPTVLKQLYDDIGIKITPAGEKYPGSTIPRPKVSEIKVTKPAIDRKDSSSEPREKLPASPSPAVSNNELKATSIPTSQKPLERKDVIARMLAEKAKKKATNIATESSSSSETLHNGSLAKPSVEKDAQEPKAQLPVQSKEKNKALSELARQRMEQLKKMGLKRQKSHSEDTNVSPAPVTSISNTPNMKPETTAPLHHPLPERPAITPSPSKSSTPQIPGLSFSSEPRSSPSIVENRSIGASTPFKNSLGKRPRASDFDEPIPETKKHSMTDRLVIDISEDESMDEEEDIGMPETSDPAINVPPPKASSSLPRATISRNASSSSVTSQSRTNELESLRQKNLEIQAMRRRIAEWEEKNAKKSKTTLPLVTMTGNGSPSLVATNIGADEDKSRYVIDKTQDTATPSDKSNSQRLQRSPSVQSLASMDNSELDQIRQKLLRKRVIESGLPTLDAELMKFEAKLAEYKREEQKLLNEIARSRQERKQLGEELESLGMETEGLTLEELRAVKEDIEQGTYTGAVLEPLDAVSSDSQPPTATLATATAADETTEFPQIPNTPLPEPGPPERREASDAADIEDPSMESSGSSMDESTSSSASSSVGQVSELESEQQAVEVPLDTSDSSVAQEDPAHDILPVETPPTATLSANLASAQKHTVDTASTVDGHNTSRESSVLTDNYEPPEPEDLDEVYSPKLSPKEGEEPEKETVPEIVTQNDADMTLTRKPQDFVVIASKGDALDNTAHSGETVSKFSPYQSPLKFFRAYRYHPNFVEEVKDSYRSLTYSHSINPLQQFCPYEAAGGVCNDATCDYQHWRDIVMPGALTVREFPLTLQIPSYLPQHHSSFESSCDFHPWLDTNSW